MKRIVLFASLLFAFCTIYGQNESMNQFGIETSKRSAPKGIEEGEQAPGFQAVDQNGTPFQLSNVLNEGPVVLFFYRGYWCPVCNQYLQNYADSLSLLTERGARVIAITPETKENIRKTQNKNNINIRIISDKKGTIMKKYGVAFHVTDGYQKKIKNMLSADIAKTNNQTDAQLPVPATYIINKEQTIVARQFDVNYKKRASIQWMLKHLPD